MHKSIALKPRLSEKSFSLSQDLNTYTFEIPQEATKHNIANAVSSQYGVKVEKVRVSRVQGKPTRSYRRGGRSVRRSQRSDIRKAYVTLAEGDVLPIFAATEEDNAKASKENK